VLQRRTSLAAASPLHGPNDTESEAYARGMLLFPFRLVWALLIGVPVAIVSAVLGTKAPSAPF
jgi:hypothetical protein